MIANAIEGSMTKTLTKKIKLHKRVYEWADDGRLIINNGPNIL